jgi:hypothetical protein
MRWNLATALLQAGRFEQGWQIFDERLELLAGITAPDCAAPVWEGQPLDGRTLLVWHEQGLGDTIQFGRYLPLLIASGARVVLRVPRELRRLCGRIAGLERVITPTEEIPQCDYQTPILSLPRVLWTGHQFAAGSGFLGALPSRRERRTDALRAGLVWAGNPNHPDDARRSLAFEDARPLLRLQGIDWLILQHGIEPPDGAPPGPVLGDL